MSTVPHDILLGRWRLTLDLFGRVFVDDVGLEPGSIISELGGFPVKEAKFRREMEKLRNSRTVDLTLSKLDRDRNNLIVQSFKEFNTHYAQNQRRSSSQPPMVVNRIKVHIIFFNKKWIAVRVICGHFIRSFERSKKLADISLSSSCFWIKPPQILSGFLGVCEIWIIEIENNLEICDS